MTREEIIRMAREAGFSVTWPETVPNFERFADLVAAAERARTVLAAFEVSERQIAAEREACAKVAADFWTEGYADEIVQGIAAEIRARGENV